MPTVSEKTPYITEDGVTHGVVIQSATNSPDQSSLEIRAPRTFLRQPLFSKFVMVRCSPDTADAPRNDWRIYLRRPLFLTGVRTIPDEPEQIALSLHLPESQDAGYNYLRAREKDDTINLLGPFGRDVALAPSCRHLLIAASPDQAPIALPAVEQMLDRNGRVTLLLRCEHTEPALLSRIPLSVEIQTSADPVHWTELLLDAIAWSDVLYICDDALTPQAWADHIRSRRLRLDDDYAQILMHADLLCCAGACRACVVQRFNGSLTRACVHGPVFPLTDLTR